MFHFKTYVFPSACMCKIAIFWLKLYNFVRLHLFISHSFSFTIRAFSVNSLPFVAVNQAPTKLIYNFFKLFLFSSKRKI